jgi:uncharacterized delta-60 repeat protein
MVVQDDGKILVAGFSNNGSNNDFALTRYNTDGTLDTSFGGGDGIVTTPMGSSNDAAYGITLQPDGKILLAGYSFNGAYSEFALARYDTDGTLDTSFSDDGKLTVNIGTYNDYGYSVTVQPDGKILLAGQSDSTTSDFALLRYKIDGSPDTSFGGGDGIVTTDILSASDSANSVTLQADGKILVSGKSNNDFAVVRYDIDGSLDFSFGGGDGIVVTDIDGGTDDGKSLTLQPDGKILVAGQSHNGSDFDFALVRYKADGTLDTSFSTDGKLTIDFGLDNDYAYSVTVQADGKILLAGSSNDNFALIRCDADGILDTSFNGTGKLITDVGSNDTGYSVTVQADGKILVAGTSGNDFALLRYNPDGTLDTRFDLVNTLDGTPSFTEGGPAVVLDADVQIFDAELSEADNFSGATLTLVRNGGADGDDVFSATGTLSALIEGGNLVVGGTTIGTVTTKSGGTLVLTFNSNATNTLVNQAMQQIAYSNTNDDPPASVQIDWTFNDGNIGAQGSGGALTASGSTTVTITSVNDWPIVTTTASQLAYFENDGAVLVDSGLTLSDPDDTDLSGATVRILFGFVTGEDSLNFTDQLGITGSYDAGTGTLTLTGTASVADYQTALRSITYQNSSEQPNTGNRTINFTVSDGVSMSGSNRTVTVTAVNDAPTLDNSGDMTLTTITEDEIANTGNTVAEIIASAGGDRIADPDAGAVEGIAVTALNSSNGTWQYSINGGGTWIAVGTVSDSSALLLRASDKLRFVPDTLNADSASVTFRAWDQTDGAAGSKVDVSSNGGMTAFSTATETASINVTHRDRVHQRYCGQRCADLHDNQCNANVYREWRCCEPLQQHEYRPCGVW